MVTHSIVGHHRDLVASYLLTLDLEANDVSAIYNETSGISWAHALYRRTGRPETERLAKSLIDGLEQDIITFNKDTKEFHMIHDPSSDLANLMWQVALTNWDTTRKELTAEQVMTMARISLQVLERAVLGIPPSQYDPDQVTRALEKTTVVLKELNERAKRALPQLRERPQPAS